MWGALETSSTPSAGEVPDTERLLDTLARVDDLRVPPSVERAGGGVGFAGRRAYLSDLLSRDPAVFLERHGDAVHVAHLALFDHLRGDYEVDFHLRRLAAASSPSETRAAEARRVARNRRFAHLATLEREGYFQEDAMRRREPLLFDTYVGAPRPTAPPADDDTPSTSHAVSLSLLDREDDRDAAERLAAARARARAAAAAEETDDDQADQADERDVDDVETNGNGNGVDSIASGVVVARGREGTTRTIEGGVSIRSTARESRATPEELRRAAVEGWGGGPSREDPDARTGREGGSDRARTATNASASANASRDARVEEFRRMMRERYLDGADGDADYRRVDADASLDDAWTREAAQDAEDAYFDGE